MYLHNNLKKYFSSSQSLFDQMMALSGECFRHQEGRLTQRVVLGDKSYFIKQHTGVGWKEIFKNLLQFRLPILSAKNEWRALEKLQELNISVPAIMAFGKRGINPATQKSFILMEELSPIISLETLCLNWRQVRPAFKFKRMLIEKIAYIARVLHQNGINHRDFYICHFLLDTTQGDEVNDPAQMKLYLIDLHRAQIRRLTPERWIIKDLSGLYFSSKDIGLTQRDWYRFMKVYHHQPLRKIFARKNKFWKKVKNRGEQLYRATK